MFTGYVNSRKIRIRLSPWCIFINPANDKGSSVGMMLVSYSYFVQHLVFADGITNFDSITNSVLETLAD